VVKLGSFADAWRPQSQWGPLGAVSLKRFFMCAAASTNSIPMITLYSKPCRRLGKRRAVNLGGRDDDLDKFIGLISTRCPVLTWQSLDMPFS
jgi:hypothetical protein